MALIPIEIDDSYTSGYTDNIPAENKATGFDTYTNVTLIKVGKIVFFYVYAYNEVVFSNNTILMKFSIPSNIGNGKHILTKGWSRVGLNNTAAGVEFSLENNKISFKSIGDHPIDYYYYICGAFCVE